MAEKLARRHARALFADRIAGAIIRVLSFGVILCVVGIFFNLFWVVWPIFQNPSFKKIAQFPLSLETLARLQGEGSISQPQIFFSSQAPFFFFLKKNGGALVYSLPNARLVEEIPSPNLENSAKITLKTPAFQSSGLEPAALKSPADSLLSYENYLGDRFTYFYPKGTALMVVANLQKEGKNQLEVVKKFFFSPDHFRFGAARLQEGEFVSLVGDDQGKVLIHFEKESTDFAGNKTQEKKEQKEQLSFIPDFFVLDSQGKKAIFANQAGDFELWERTQGQFQKIGAEKISPDGIQNISFLFGNETFLIDTPSQVLELMKSSGSNGQGKPFVVRQQVEKLQPNSKLAKTDFSRIFMTFSQGVDFFYSTTAKHLASFSLVTKQEKEQQEKGQKEGFFSPLVAVNTDKGSNYLGVLQEDGNFSLSNMHLSFPELGFKTYFSKLFFEGYPQPTYTWQSSSASEDYEPKLSFVPLVVGSLKGAFYAMLFSFPVGVIGAIYLSQFAKARVRKYLKPLVEVMATIPSVVIGFLASIWLGPYFEKFFVSILTSLFFFYAFYRFFTLKNTKLTVFLEGREFLFLVFPAAFAILCGYYAGNGMEQFFWGGNFKHYLFEHFQIKYEQQNAIITALALGLAAIPIIFTITDDALRSVPETLRAASLALGASKWQTVLKVIVPSASSGIFAALILGISRAVGETMIVLMASGNTPLVDFHLFSGMRTLAANIAVEISEAPLNGALYRTLFLSGLVLFLFTFFMNLLAEVVRTRLKKRFRSA